MIIPPEPAPPAVRTRPATVTTAFGLQLALVAALLLFAALTVVEAVIYDGLVDKAASLTNPDPDDVSGERAFNVEFAVITGLPAVLMVALYAATALPVRNGRNVARILTCVGAGLPLLCCVAGDAVGSLAMIPFALEDPEQLEEEGMWPADSPFYDKLYDLESTGAAGAVSALVPTLAALALALSIAIAVLLLVPPSNRYFRPPAPPPPPMPAYPFAYPVPHGYMLVPITPAEPPPTPATPEDTPPPT